MKFIVVCIDKNDPSKSELASVEETPEQMKSEFPEPLDTMVFTLKDTAEKWIFDDECDFPGIYHYHIIQVG